MNNDVQSTLSNVGNVRSSGDDIGRLALVPPIPTIKAPSSKPTDKSCIEKKARRTKKWKKPKDKPSRPLSAYNFFFQSERSIMLGVNAPNKELESLKKRVHCKTHGKIGFAEMARAIGAKWKSLDPDKRKIFDEKAQKEKNRYKLEIASWKASHQSSGNEGSKGLQTIADAAAMTSEESLKSQPIQNSVRENFVHRPTTRTIVTANMEDIHTGNMSLIHAGQSESNYVRALRDRQLGLSIMESMLLRYPRAAESSATALLRHFQGAAYTALPFSRATHQLYQIDHLANTASSFYPSSSRDTIQKMKSYLSNNPNE